MSWRRGTYAIVAAVATCLVTFQTASATAFAGVDTATWSIFFFDPLNAVTIDYHLASVSSLTTTSGGGVANTGFSTSVGGDFVGQNAFGRSIVNGPGYAATNLDIWGVVTITNTADFPLVFGDVLGYSNFSAFNPGGNSIGASVNDPMREFAFFESTVWLETIGDFHSCETSLLVLSCGVDSPDSSQDQYYPILNPSEVMSINVHLAIATEARVVPEPSALALFATGLLAVFGRLLAPVRRLSVESGFPSAAGRWSFAKR